MVNGFRPGVRYTHVPTGISATVEYIRPAQRRWAEGVARSWLAAKLCRPAPEPRPVRTYAFPFPGVAYVRQGDRLIASGVDEVQAMLDGKREFPVPESEG